MLWTRLVLAVALFAIPSSSVGQSNAPLPRDIYDLTYPNPKVIVPRTSTKRLKYGKKYWQRISYFPADSDVPAPLVVVLRHPRNEWFRYRLVKAGIAVAYIPGAADYDGGEDYLQNYATALGYLLERADDLKLDRNRLIIAGYGSTARTAVLFGTSEEWLVDAGIPFSHLRGVIAHGGTGYSYPRRRSEGDLEDNKLGFEDDAVRFAPVEHLDPPNAPAFLFMAEVDDRDSVPDSKEIATIFENAGIETQLVILPDEVGQVTASLFLVEPDGSGSEFIPWVLRQFEMSD